MNNNSDKNNNNSDKNNNNSCNNDLLFFKVFNNIVIRKIILKHLRLYNLYSHQLILNDINSLNNTKYKDYMKSIKIIINENNINEINNLFNNNNNNNNSSSNNNNNHHQQQQQYNNRIPNYIDTFEIKLDDSFYNDIENGIKLNIINQLPTSITSLTIDANICNTSINLDNIPSNIKYLKLINYNNNLRESKQIKNINNSSSSSISKYSNILNMYNAKYNQKSTPIYGLESLDLGGGSFNYFILENSLPKTLTSLIFPDTFNLPIGPSVLPDSLTFLRLGSTFQYKLNDKVLPKSLKQLELFNYSSCLPSSPSSIFPPGLKKLLLSNYTFPIQKDSLPPSLECLTLHGQNQDLGSVYLPLGLQSLVLVNYYIGLKFIKNHNSLPPSLKYLKIIYRGYGDLDLSGLQELPNTIEQVIIRSTYVKFKQDIFSSLPSLKSLILCRDIHSIGSLPVSLRKIKFDSLSVATSFQGLVNLESFSVDDLFCSLTQDMFPVGLKKIKIYYCGTGISNLNLPSTITHLKINEYIGSVIQDEIRFPESLLYLTINFNFNNIQNHLPNQLKYLSTLNNNITSTTILPESIKLLCLSINHQLNQNQNNNNITLYIPSNINILVMLFKNKIYNNNNNNTIEINQESLQSSSLQDIYISKSNTELLLNNNLYESIKDKIKITTYEYSIPFRYSEKLIK